MKALFLALSFYLLTPAWAEECAFYFAKAPSAARIEIGAKVELVGEGGESSTGIFLGRLVEADGSSREYSFFDVNKNSIQVVPESRIQISNPAGPVAPEHTAPLVKNIAQVGPTCGAFSIYNCVRMHHLDSTPGAEDALSLAMADEASRMRTLTAAVNQQWNHSDNAFNDLTRVIDPLGLEATPIYSQEIETQLLAGKKILIDYNITKEMVKPEYTLHDGKQWIENLRLWLPQPAEEPTSWRSRLFGWTRGSTIYGRHRVLALAVFEHEGKRRILISDPNWVLPRLWDIEELNKANSSNMHAFMIDRKPPAPPAAK